MMSSRFYLFYLEVMETLNLEVLYLRVFSELAILEWFLSWHFKHFLYVIIIKDMGIFILLCYQIFMQKNYQYIWETLVSQNIL